MIDWTLCRYQLSDILIITLLHSVFLQKDLISIF